MLVPGLVFFRFVFVNERWNAAWISHYTNCLDDEWWQQQLQQQNLYVNWWNAHSSSQRQTTISTLIFSLSLQILVDFFHFIWSHSQRKIFLFEFMYFAAFTVVILDCCTKLLSAFHVRNVKRNVTMKKEEKWRWTWKGKRDIPTYYHNMELV